MPKPSTIRQARYDKTHRTAYVLQLSLKNDADVIEKLNSVPNKQGYIKQLIRADIVRQQTIAELQSKE